MTIGAVLCVLLLPAAALAGSSSCQQYSSQSCSQTQSSTTTSRSTSTPAPAPPSSTVASTTQSRGTLPFTGLDIGLLAAGGGLLLGAGLVVRRLSSQR
ncbi:MAG: hypothetical protein ACRDMX_06765 [Solirubrobacteraceae bacterium]